MSHEDASAPVGLDDSCVLRRARQDARRSQEDLADAAGLNMYYVRELEYGQKSASLNAVVRLASALGRRPHDLVNEAEAGWADIHSLTGGAPA